MKGKKQAIGEILSKYSSLVPSVQFGDGAASVDLGKSVGSFGDSLSGSDILEDRKKFEGILEDEKKRVVVLIDDIDRLDKSEVQALFKLVKLTADFSYIHYILAFDDQIVSDALGGQYGHTGEAGRRFLEKIVQVPLHLPMADQLSLRQFTFDAINEALSRAGIEVNENEGYRFVAVFRRKLELGIRTPRMAKTYANALSFSLQILKGEVNPVDLMLIEGVRIIYPKLYVAIRAHKDLFLGSLPNIEGDKDKVASRTRTVLEEATKALSPEEMLAAKDVALAIFPMLLLDNQDSVLVSNDDSKWAKAKRICSEEYFDRYFTFAVPLHDISDQVVDSLIALAEGTSTAIDVQSKLTEILAEHKAEAFLSKVDRKKKTLTPEGSEKLAIAFSKAGSSFDVPMRRAVMPFSVQSEAAMLTGQLLENIQKIDRRIATTKTIVNEGEPLYFVQECLSWMRPDNADREKTAPFTDEQYRELGKALAERIKRTHTEEALYTRCPKYAARLLLAWASSGDRAETNKSLSDAIESNPRVAIQIIKLFRTRWFIGEREEFRFDGQQYEALIKIVDPDKIYGALTKLFASEILKIVPDNFTHEPSNEDESCAQQFTAIYRTVSASE